MTSEPLTAPIVRALVEERLRAGLTQRQVGERMGKRQCVIGTFEQCKHESSLKTMGEYALAVGCGLVIIFAIVPLDELPDELPDEPAEVAA